MKMEMAFDHIRRCAGKSKLELKLELGWNYVLDQKPLREYPVEGVKTR